MGRRVLVTTESGTILRNIQSSNVITGFVLVINSGVNKASNLVECVVNVSGVTRLDSFMVGLGLLVHSDSKDFPDLSDLPLHISPRCGRFDPATISTEFFFAARLKKFHLSSDHLENSPSNGRVGGSGDSTGMSRRVLVTTESGIILPNVQSSNEITGVVFVINSGVNGAS